VFKAEARDRAKLIIHLIDYLEVRISESQWRPENIGSFQHDVICEKKAADAW
jgi:hypothetical protein